MKSRNAWLVAIVLAVLVVAGCSSGPRRPDLSTLPDGAIGLTQNQPNRTTVVEGRRVVMVATNIDESGACLDVWGPDMPGTGDCVNIGGTIELDGITLRLVATWVNPEPPGKGDSARKSLAWVVAESGDIPSPPTGGTPSDPKTSGTAPPTGE